MTQELSKDEMIQKIVIERLRNMSTNVKIALGSGSGFLNREDMIREVSGDTPIGKKIVKIQVAYLQSLKKTAK